MNKCSFGLHDWHQWQVKKRESLVNITNGAYSGEYSVQEKSCKVCGLNKIKITKEFL